VDRAADVGAEDVIDELVLRDAREAGEGGGDHGGAEVVPGARQVDHLGVRVGICASIRALRSSVVGIGF
jgi:hypothetical protein